MLINIVKTYLSVRRALGFKLQSVEKYLWSYANFATARGDIRVLSKTAVEWAELAFASRALRTPKTLVIKSHPIMFSAAG